MTVVLVTDDGTISLAAALAQELPHALPPEPVGQPLRREYQRDRAAPSSTTTPRRNEDTLAHQQPRCISSIAGCGNLMSTSNSSASLMRRRQSQLDLIAGYFFLNAVSARHHGGAEHGAEHRRVPRGVAFTPAPRPRRPRCCAHRRHAGRRSCRLINDSDVVRFPLDAEFRLHLGNVRDPMR